MFVVLPHKRQTPHVTMYTVYVFLTHVYLKKVNLNLMNQVLQEVEVTLNCCFCKPNTDVQTTL